MYLRGEDRGDDRAAVGRVNVLVFFASFFFFFFAAAAAAAASFFFLSPFAHLRLGLRSCAAGGAAQMQQQAVW